MILFNTEWWGNYPVMNIYINEYEILRIPSENNDFCPKRRLLCEQHYQFYLDSDEDDLQKVKVTIKDNSMKICFFKIYTQVDNLNRIFYTTR